MLVILHCLSMIRMRDQSSWLHGQSAFTLQIGRLWESSFTRTLRYFLHGRSCSVWIMSVRHFPPWHSDLPQVYCGEANWPQMQTLKWWAEIRFSSFQMILPARCRSAHQWMWHLEGQGQRIGISGTDSVHSESGIGVNYVRPYFKNKQKKVGFLKYFVTEIDDKRKGKLPCMSKSIIS